MALAGIIICQLRPILYDKTIDGLPTVVDHDTESGWNKD